MILKKCFICEKPFIEDAKNNYIKSKRSVIILENIELLFIKYAILCIMHKEKYQLYFIIVLVMITIS